MTGIVGVFSLTGMNTVITRAVAQGYDGTFKYSLLLQLKWSLPQFILLLSIALYYFLQDNTIYALAFLVVSIFGPISGIANSFNTFLHGKQDFKTSAFFNIQSALIYFTATVGFVFYIPSIVWLIVSYFGVKALANVFFCFSVLKRYPPQKPFLRDEDVSYAKHLSIMNIVSSVAQQIDSIAVYHLLGPVQLAIYTFSTIMPDRIRSIFNSLTVSILPKLSEKNGGSWESLVIKMKQFIIFASFLIIIYIFSATYFYELFFPQYLDSIWYSQIYALSLLMLPTSISLPVLQAKRSQKELYILNIITPLLKIVVTCATVVLWGILGAILSKVIYYLLYTYLSTYYMKQRQTNRFS
jgi:O-antigen/teichoic acid export membrane protein